jgi:hypothetical protein
MPANAGSLERMRARAAPKSMPTPADASRNVNHPGSAAANRTLLLVHGADQAERDQLGSHPPGVLVRTPALVVLQGIDEEGLDVDDRARFGCKEFKRADGGRIQQMDIPGNRIEDGALVAEVEHAQPGGCDVSGSLRAPVVVVRPAHARISDE